MKSLDGYKTYIALALAFLGLLGYGELISEGEVAQLIDLITQVIGILGAVYGRWHASYRAKKLVQ